MTRLLRIISILIIAGAWLALCGIGLFTPTLIRRPMSIAIGNLKHTEIDYKSVSTWEALTPISDFTVQTGNWVILLSTLMLAGFVLYQRCIREEKTPAMRNLPLRIREIDRASLPKFELNSDLFFLMWLLCNLIAFMARRFMLGSIPYLYVLVAFYAFAGASIFFLIRTMKILYRPNYFWGNLVAYIVSYIIPLLGAALGLAVALSVFIDSRKVVKTIGAEPSH